MRRTESGEKGEGSRKEVAEETRSCLLLLRSFTHSLFLRLRSLELKARQDFSLNLQQFLWNIVSPTTAPSFSRSRVSHFLSAFVTFAVPPIWNPGTSLPYLTGIYLCLLSESLALSLRCPNSCQFSPTTPLVLVCRAGAWQSFPDSLLLIISSSRSDRESCHSA